MLFFRNILGSLLMALVISSEVKGQCTKPTTTENAGIHPDDIIKDTFEDQSTIRLKCHPGYEPAAGSSLRRLTCENGQWTPSPTKFVCTKKSCGNPGDVSNGRYEYQEEGLLFGSVIKAVCNLGFNIIGTATRTCLADGTWDGREAVCEAVKCGPPPPITNGKLKSPPKDEYDAGNAEQYECDPDYTLIGVDTVGCQNNGSWSSPPRCLKVECPKPNIPNAIRIQGGSGPYGYRATLEYKCNTGFKMTTDSGRMVCLEHGWSSIPECKEVECPKVNPTNATITQEAVGPYRFQDFIEYKCPDGQYLVGSVRLTCGSDGRWSSNPPVCLKELTCLKPPATSATITEGAGGSYKPGDIIKYTCPDGKKLDGSSELKCGSDGQWSSIPPECKDGGDSITGPVLGGIFGAVIVVGLIIFGIRKYMKKRKSYAGPQCAAEGQELKGTDQDNGV